jgi:16S rRNA (uracil1498-N3)-methyltransferase
VSAPQFFVQGLAEGERAVLRDEDARHALRSLRLQPGDEVVLADGAGAVARGRLGERDGRAIVDVDEVRQVARPVPALCVAMAPPKGDRLAWAVQKLAEVGVDEIVLMESERAVRRWGESERGERARRRLEVVAREAAMQSRRPFVPAIGGPSTLMQALDAGKRGTRVVVLWEGAEAPLGELLGGPATMIRLVVGPEGGFAAHEVGAARAAGAHVASLGDGILRTETAALAATVVALHHLGRLG